MANSVLDWVWAHSQARHGARLVLLAIADRARQDGGAWMSIADLRSRTLLSERAVQMAVTELIRSGELKVGRQEGPYGVNRYQVTMSVQVTVQVTPQDPATLANTQNLRGADSAPSVSSAQLALVSSNGAGHPARPRNSCEHADAESAPGTHKNLEKPSPKASPRRPDPNAGREDARRICEHLADQIESNGNLRPAINKTKWLDPARLLLDKDGRTEDQVHRAIDWATRNEFWRRNIRSVSKLREHYDRLREEAEAERRRTQLGGSSGNPNMRGGARQRVLSAEEAEAVDPRSIV